MLQCKAKSKRSGKRCKRYASKGKEVCRCHGGRSTGPKTKEGKERSRLSVLKHGRFTKEAKDERRYMKALLKECQQTLISMNS